MTKLVSQLDENGYFIGPAYADESPLEPGVYLLSAGCVDVPPPLIPAGQRARWVAGDFIFEAAGNPQDQEPAPDSIDEWRARTAVSRFQARAALYQAGHLSAVESLMNNETTPMLARLAWQDAQEFRRNSPTVLSMGAALGFTPEDLDALFVAAGQIAA